MTNSKRWINIAWGIPSIAKNLQLAVSLIVLPISLQYVERLWGALETVKFVFITTVVSNIIAVFVNIIEHFIIGKDGYFLYVEHL
jgi:hypothetical protein